LVWLVTGLRLVPGFGLRYVRLVDCGYRWLISFRLRYVGSGSLVVAVCCGLVCSLVLPVVALLYGYVTDLDLFLRFDYVVCLIWFWLRLLVYGSFYPRLLPLFVFTDVVCLLRIAFAVRCGWFQFGYGCLRTFALPRLFRFTVHTGSPLRCTVYTVSTLVGQFYHSRFLCWF
jgi:hypothetical protein